jgi:hypothetical protein
MLAVLSRMTQTRPYGIVRDRWLEIMRRAYEAVGRYWLQNMLPLHFKPGAASKYHYAFRSEAYLLRKFGESHGGLHAKGVPRNQHFAQLRKMDDQQPLVLTGYMRDQVLKNNTVRGFPTRATVRLFGPGYMGAKLSASFRSKSDDDASKYTRVQPNKIKEMTTVLVSECKILSKVLVNAIAAGIAAVRGAERVTGEAA